MQFTEPAIASIDYLEPKAIYHLIVGELCGEKYHREFNEVDRRHLAEFLQLTDRDGITYERFNELLLLLEQDRVSESFYRFFFAAHDPLKLKDLVSRVVNFRGYAMLRYGNIRFAYKSLITMNQAQLTRQLRPYWEQSAAVESRYRIRPSGALQIEPIDRDKTWGLGYIARIKHDKESKLLAEALNRDPTNQETLALAEIYRAIGEMIEETRAKGLRNTDVYLTWDYMDVYVATSMRKKWDFEDVADFVRSLFSDERLRGLKLRYFDPTQSDCTSRIDKGLVEALMLKRASCTVYLVQESDTLGKDSELASTLAQGKPVIAFVPSVKVDEYARKVRLFPLEYFKIRFRILQAEGVFEEPALRQELLAADSEFADTVDDFLETVDEFNATQPFTLWEAKQLEFKQRTKLFDRVCSIVAIAEKYNFDKRAQVLKSIHPLSLQVHLESGVAHGVLVVRTVQECAEVLQKLLTNSLSFRVEFDEKQKCTMLVETISQSPFRVVTEYEKLSNSFWNFYLVSRKTAQELIGDEQV
jgi:Txe/YoeB family toxin of Txe-Axe toxin-antitoxin module